MNKPRFSTILQQAKEQCNKQYGTLDNLSDCELIVKFFASGMEYRMSHEHVVAERTFLSSYNQAEFLMGYLQGKNADKEMLDAIEAECINSRINRVETYFTSVFQEGLFYEEYILQKKQCKV